MTRSHHVCLSHLALESMLSLSPRGQKIDAKQDPVESGRAIEACLTDKATGEQKMATCSNLTEIGG